MTMRTLLAVLAVLAMPTAVSSQSAPAPPGTGAAAPAPASAPAPAPPGPADNFVYESEGRRDPFLDLLGTGNDSGQPQRGSGAAGLMLGEISVRGIMQSRGSLIAMIQGPDNKTYLIHPGDKLADGVVKSVTPQGLIVVQQISDPLSIQKQREVRKLLRSLEGAKE
jgi:Tfp pilus assembly protein PilP